MAAPFFSKKSLLSEAFSIDPRPKLLETVAPATFKGMVPNSLLNHTLISSPPPLNFIVCRIVVFFILGSGGSKPGVATFSEVAQEVDQYSDFICLVSWSLLQDNKNGQSVARNS